MRTFICSFCALNSSSFFFFNQKLHSFFNASEIYLLFAYSMRQLEYSWPLYLSWSSLPKAYSCVSSAQHERLSMPWCIYTGLKRLVMHTVGCRLPAYGLSILLLEYPCNNYTFKLNACACFTANYGNRIKLIVTYLIMNYHILITSNYMPNSAIVYLCLT